MQDAGNFNPFDSARHSTGMVKFAAVLASVITVPIGLIGLGMMASDQAGFGVLVALGGFGTTAFAWIMTSRRTQDERQWQDGLRRHWHASSDVGWATYLSGLHTLQTETGSDVALLRCGDDLCVFNSKRKVLVILVRDIESVGIGSESATYSEWDPARDVYETREGVAADLLQLRLRGHGPTTTFRMSSNDDVHRWKDILSSPV